MKQVNPRRRARCAVPGAHRDWKGQEGFTLVELLLVLLIISVLAGLVVPRFADRARQAHIQAAIADIEGNIPTALELYELDAGAFPTTQQGLAALDREPSSPPAPARWNGPYVRAGVPRDPWGNPYAYRNPSTHGNPDYDIFSMGPDGQEGGGDDITNWSDEHP